ncbi:hypothetical protein BLSTO_04165 [Blastocystis sp. subtype 1]
MFDKPLRLTMCFSTSKSDEVGISFRYQIGNEMKPINKAPRTEYVTSSDVDNLADKLQAIATEIYAMQDEQRYTREKQHNYKADLQKLKNKVLFRV